ncbi:MAG: hypothetical protein AABX16_04220 [Nanoarchaeota archaeon]
MTTLLESNIETELPPIDEVSSNICPYFNRCNARIEFKELSKHCMGDYFNCTSYITREIVKDILDSIPWEKN